MLSRSAVCLVSSLVATTALAADPVGTWQLDGRVRVTACARGRCQSDSQPGAGTLIIAADGTYTVPSDPTGCDAPDEQGTWVAKRRGRYVLKPSNVRQLVQAVWRCLGISNASFHGHVNEVFIPNGDGTTATARIGFSGGGTYRGIAFTASATGRYTGTRIAASGRGDASPPASAGAAALIDGVMRAVR